MAFQTRVSKAALKATIDTLVGRLDIGTGAAAKVYICSGAQPASPDVGTMTKLATFTLSATAFGNATTDTATTYIAASMSGGTKTDASAVGTGTAAWFRAVDKNDAAVIDGDVGTTLTTADMAIDNTSITAGQTVKLTSWKVRQAYK